MSNVTSINKKKPISGEATYAGEIAENKNIVIGKSIVQVDQ